MVSPMPIPPNKKRSSSERELRPGISPDTELCLARWWVLGHRLQVIYCRFELDWLDRTIRQALRRLLTYSESHRLLRLYTQGNWVDVVRAAHADDPDTRFLGRMLVGQPGDLELHIRSRRELRNARRESDRAWDHYLALAEWFGFDP